MRQVRRGGGSRGGGHGHDEVAVARFDVWVGSAR